MTDAAARLGTEALSADEIADAVWLAARIATAEPRRRATKPPAEQPSSRTRPPRPQPSPRPPPEPTEADPPTKAPPEPTREEPTRPEPTTRERQHPPETVIDWNYQEWRDLPQGLAKALLPLNQYVLSARRNELDEEQTAVGAAESGVWLPVHRPVEEHPFELVLVVDHSWSMRIWDRTVAAFRALLERQGAFTDVKTYLVNTNEDTIRSMESIPGTTSSPKQLSDPTGRRLVLIVTDGVGRAWRTGSMHGWMSLWARTCQVALVHLLPPNDGTGPAFTSSPSSSAAILPTHT